jgi:hypothetical protein
VHAHLVAVGQLADTEKLVVFCDRGYDNQAVPEEFQDIVKVEFPKSPANRVVLSVEEWTKTRRVTAWRNVVEHYNRRLQEFKLLRDHVPNKIAPKLLNFIRAVATLQQMWRRPLRDFHALAEKEDVAMQQNAPEEGKASDSRKTNKLHQAGTWRAVTVLTHCVVSSALQLTTM